MIPLALHIKYVGKEWFYMVDSTRYKDWLEKADRDLKSAKVLIANACGNDVVAFHCQQTIEKALKGFILKNTSELTEGHSLLYLCKQASNFMPFLKTKLKDCAYVNQYYIETRYPADIPLVVTDEEATECILIAETIYNLILENSKE